MSRRRFPQKLFSVILTVMLVMQNFSGSLVVQSALASDSGIESKTEAEPVSAGETEITSSSADKNNIESTAEELPSEEPEEEPITEAPQETGGVSTEAEEPAATPIEPEAVPSDAETTKPETAEPETAEAQTTEAQTVGETLPAEPEDPATEAETTEPTAEETEAPEEEPATEALPEETAEETTDAEETESFDDSANYGIMLTGLDEDAQTDAVFPSGNYNLEYILNRFNAVSFGDVTMDIHCMGSVLIKGDFSGTGSGFADSGQISAPSYIGGKVSYTGPHASRHNASGIDLYVGTGNTVTNGNKDLNGMSDFNKSGLIYKTDSYVNWDMLKSNIQATSNSLPAYSTETINLEYSWQTVKIKAGSNVILNTNGMMAQIELEGSSELATVINILEPNVNPFPKITNLSASEDGYNMPLVWNLPNAASVKVGSESTPEFGHIVAPNAAITMGSGNYNGCLIGASLSISGEGHMWPYRGGSLIPAAHGFQAVKTVDGETPKAGESFAFRLDEWNASASQWETKQQQKNNGKSIVFDEISYSKDSDIGDHWYMIYEDQTPVPGYQLSTDRYAVKVTVTKKTSGDDVIYEKSGETYYRVSETADPAAVQLGSYYLIPIAQGGGNPIVFNNTTDLKEAKVTFSGTKSITGIGSTDKVFTFELFETGADYAVGTQPLMTVSTVGNITGSQQFSFSEITYETEGTRYYVIREKAPEQADGFAVDKHEYKLEVRVVNNGKGELEAKVTGADADKIDFTNNYSASGSITLEASKTLTGKALSKGQFGFSIDQLDENGEPMKENAGFHGSALNDENGTIVFPTINYTEAGTYSYVIKEKDGAKKGYTYDSAEYTVVIKVEDNQKGKLEASVTEVKKDGNPVENRQISFANTYVASGSVTLEAMKNLIGDASLRSGMFAFTLSDSDGNVLQTVTNTNKTISFAPIRYTQEDAGKTFEYVIAEVKGDLPGYSYDTNTFKAIVKVTDNGNGTLTVTSSYQSAANQDTMQRPVFSNTYAAEGSIILTAEKQLSGKMLSADQFTFHAQEVDEKGNKVVGGYHAHATNDISGKIVFGEIKYKKAGTYYYQITEMDQHEQYPEYKYDSSIFTVTVQVKDNDDGTLHAQVTERKKGNDSVGEILFKNEYQASGSFVVNGVKKLNDGEEPENGQFTFVLTDDSGKVIQSVKNQRSTIVFDAIHYNAEDIGKTYTYIVSEVDEGKNGYTYDKTKYRVTVKVKDGGSGNLYTDVTYHSSATGSPVNGIVFYNTYTASGELILRAEKSLTGRELSANQFGFELYEVDQNGEPVEGGYSNSARNDEAGDIGFKISYTEAGTYYYLIAEEDEKQPGYSYDDSVYRVTVKVTDDGEGNLQAKVSELYRNNNKLKPTDPILFANTYEAKGSFTLTAQKHLTGEGTMDDGQFEFLLVGNGVSQRKSNKGGEVVFDPITYTQSDIGRIYTYTVTEIDKKDSGYIYDKTYYMASVKIVDNGDGTLTPVAEYWSSATKGTVEAVVFNNIYKADGEIVLKAEKNLSGRTLEKEQFTFQIVQVDEFGKRVDGGYAETAFNDASGTILFPAISYENSGTYYYQITEENGGDHNYTYDASVYTVVVEVTNDGDGNLIAAVAAAYKDNEELKDDKYVIFRNSYRAKGEVQLKARKELLSGESKLQDGQFSFILADNTGILQIKTNDGNGDIVFDPISYTQADSGKTFVYIIQEIPKGAPGYTYDRTRYTVRVTVKDNGDGTLSFDQTYEASALLEEEDEEIVFRNSYQTSGEITIEAQKLLTAGTLEGGEFTFEINEVDEDGKPVEDGYYATAKNDEDGAIVFPTITYSKSGTYRYKVTEQKDEKQYYDYDASEYYVTVTAKDNQKGSLETKITSIGKKKSGESAASEEERIVFRNKYRAKGELTLEAFKILHGEAELKDGEFTFILSDESGKVLQTKTNIGSSAVFDSISYTQDDIGKTFIYTVKELADSEKSYYQYDTTEYEVAAKIVDRGNGLLEADTTYTVKGKADKAYELLFINSYRTEGRTVLTAEKSLTGTALEDGQFRFTAVEVDQDGNKVKDGYTGTAVNKGTAVSFPEITYSKSGTYYYQITEENDQKPGYTYDDSVYVVTVEAEDNGRGTLETAVTDVTRNGQKLSADAEVAFKNTYLASGSIRLEAVKYLEGEAALQDGDFEFTLSEGNKVKQTKTNVGNKVSFDEIKYTQDDIGETYIYTVKEVDGNKEGYTYDATEYTVTVSIGDNGNGTLSVEAVYGITGKDVTVEELAFTNTYTTDGKIILTAQKSLTGTALEDGQFRFTAVEVDKDGNEVKDGYTGTAVNKGTAVSFPEITYSKSGTYYYQITEENDQKPGYTYDGSVYVVTVKAEDHGAGTLTAAVTEVTKNGDAWSLDQAIVFENRYEASGELTLQAVKTMKSEDAELGTFTFELKDENGQVIDIASNTETGAVIFNPLKYDQEDAGKTFVYTVSEKAEEASAYLYDETVYTVTVKVEDNGDSTLTIAAEVDGESYADDLMQFVNDVTRVKISKVDIADEKELEGAVIRILDKDGNVVEEWVSAAEPHEVTGLNTGETYTLRETAAPKGYGFATDIEFVINEDGTVTTTASRTDDGVILVEDAPIDFEVNKVDIETEEELAGAVLTIVEKETGEVVDKWTSEIGKTYDFGANLEAGKTYILKETAAPEYYDTIEDIEFTVDRNGTVIIDLDAKVDEDGNVIYQVKDAELIDHGGDDTEESSEYYGSNEETTEEETTAEEETTEEETTAETTEPEESGSEEEEGSSEFFGSNEETTEEETTAAEVTTTAEETTTQTAASSEEQTTSGTVILGIEDYGMVIGWICVVFGGLLLMVTCVWIFRRREANK